MDDEKVNDPKDNPKDNTQNDALANNEESDGGHSFTEGHRFPESQATKPGPDVIQRPPVEEQLDPGD